MSESNNQNQSKASYQCSLEDLCASTFEEIGPNLYADVVESVSSDDVLIVSKGGEPIAERSMVLVNPSSRNLGAPGPKRRSQKPPIPFDVVMSIAREGGYSYKCNPYPLPYMPFILDPLSPRVEEIHETSAALLDLGEIDSGVEEPLRTIVELDEDDDEEDDCPLKRRRRLAPSKKLSSSRAVARGKQLESALDQLKETSTRGDDAQSTKFPRDKSAVVCPDIEGEMNEDGLLPTCPSVIVEDEIPSLRSRYEIPASVEIIIPDPKHAFYNPPPGYMCVHEGALQCGWRVPIPPELREILNHIGIGPSQVIPNSLGNLLCFGILCKYKKVPITFRNFCQLFAVIPSRGNPLFYTFVTRQSYTFLEDPISSLGVKWWTRYVFVRPALLEGQPEESRKTWGLHKVFLRKNLPNWCLPAKSVAAWVKTMHRDVRPKPPRFFFRGLICQPLPYLAGFTEEVFCRDKPDFEYWFRYIMSTLREMKRQQLEAQAQEVSVGTREKVIKTSTALPLPDPKNAATFQVEQERRSATGEGLLALEVPDKGRSKGNPSKKAAKSGPVVPVDKSASKRPMEATAQPSMKKAKAIKTLGLGLDSCVERSADAERLKGISELERVQALSDAYLKLGVVVCAYKEAAGRTAKLEEELRQAEDAKAAESERAKIAILNSRKYYGQLQASEAKRARLEENLEAMKMEVDAGVDNLSTVCSKFLDFKDKLLADLLFVRMEAARDFYESPAYNYTLECAQDEMRLAGFNSAIGQLKCKGLIPSDLNLKAHDLSAFNGPDGKKEECASTSTAALEACEFAELVVNEADNLKLTHGGPFLPGCVSQVLKRSVLSPYKDFADHNQAWLKLPGPVVGQSLDMDLEDELLAERADEPQDT